VFRAVDISSGTQSSTRARCALNHDLSCLKVLLLFFFLGGGDEDNIAQAGHKFTMYPRT
jgi:hypothetical protein